MRLLIKYPSRQRPDQFVKTLNTYASMVDRPDLCEIIVSADTSDISMHRRVVTEAIERCPVKCSIHYGHSRCKVEAINADMEMAEPWDIVLLASDDMIPQVQGYDNAIQLSMQENYPDTGGGLWWYDGRQKDINTIQCLGRKEYGRLGYLYHPDYKSLWCDNEATDVGRRDNTLRFIDRCIIRNESPDWGGNQKRDPLYRRNNSFYHIDQKTYERRKALNFPR